jgi:pimeloyl-ACP methyl ester carboxylesterase
VDERWLDVDGIQVFVRTWGDERGQPVLFWHGVGLTSRGSLALSEAGPILASGHALRVVALDAPGFGKSPAAADADAYRPEALADLVPPLLDALGIERAAFMGFSWGADIGCHVAARYPERLDALVLLDAGYVDPPFDADVAYDTRVQRHEQLWREKCASSWEEVVAELRARSPRSTPEIEEGWRAGWREEDGRLVPAVAPWIVAAVEHGIAHSPPSSTWPRLAAAKLPVLSLTEGDARDEDLARFAAGVPHAEIRRIEGAGHDVLVDGGPDVVHAVGAWLLRFRSSRRC